MIGGDGMLQAEEVAITGQHPEGMSRQAEGESD